MSARTKVNGNRAIKCDVPGCAGIFVADWWGNDAASARTQARGHGWSRCLRFGDRVVASCFDVCPAHTAHPAGCSCPTRVERPIDSVPGVAPPPSRPLSVFSSQAGLASLRGPRTRANLPNFTGSRF